MKKIALLFLLTIQIPLFAQNYRIEGTVEGLEGQYVYLGEDKKTPVDSAMVTGGKFMMENKLQEVKPLMLKIGTNRQHILLEENPIHVTYKSVLMEYKGKTFNRGQMSVKGSQDQALYQKMNQALTQEMMTMLAISLSGEENQDNPALKDSLGVMFIYAKNHTKQVFDSIVDHHTDSYVSAMIINDHFAKDHPLEELEGKYQRLSDRVKNSSLGEKIRHTLAILKATGIGQVAPDFTLPTPDGGSLTLSSLRGKCVLVDFWASWCGPCIKELPNIKKVYEKYHARGFEVVSISLDDKEANWTKAIEKHQIPWLHASSLKGWKCPVAKLYHVTGVPAMYLLDAEGRIVTDNARGEVLEQEVAKLCPQAPGISFQQGDWKSVMDLARQADKPIFLDIYTSWCGPCKMMANKVFPQPEVGDYFNANFINYKIDAEKGEGIEIAKKYQVNSYPTCLFLTHEGKIVSSFMGAKDVKSLLKEGATALKNYRILPELEALEAEYNNGNRQKEFLQKYCVKREEFGTKGGQPVFDYVQLLGDDELLLKENARWIQTLDIYDKDLMNRMVNVLQTNLPTRSSKEMTPFNNAIMKSLSTFINQSMEANKREEFEQLIGYKKRMNELMTSNNDNGVSASMGGGISYLATEQIQLAFYNKNKCDKEFSTVFLTYLQQKMAEHPTDSLIRNSNEEELTYSKLMKSDSVSVEDKKEIKQGRDLMKMFSGVKFQLLASTLFNAASHYWELNQPASENLRKDYLDWLKFFYALNRCSDVAIPVAEKMKELGYKTEAKALLEDLITFLSIQEDTAEEVQKVRNWMSSNN